MVTPVEQPRPVDAAAQLPLGQRQLPAVVDALHLLGVVDREGVDPVAGVVEDGDDVGQVVLALGVVGGDPPQRRAEQVAPEAVDGGVDLLDGPLLRGGVGLLDHPGDEAVLVADQPSVARRLAHVGGEDGGAVAPGLVEGDQAGEGLAAAAAACRPGRSGRSRCRRGRRRRRRSCRPSPRRPCPAGPAAPRRRRAGSAGSRPGPAWVTRCAPWPTTTTVRSMSRPSRACRTCTTIGRPQMTWRGFGRSDRMRVPWPAAKTIAEMLTPTF